MHFSREFNSEPTHRSPIRQIQFPEGSLGIPMPDSPLVHEVMQKIFADEDAILELEIADLTGYLAGLPPNLAESDAFSAYRDRLARLTAEKEGREQQS